MFVFFLHWWVEYVEVPVNPGEKSGRSSDESALIKRKRIDAVSPNDRRAGERNGSVPISKNLTQSEPSKRPKAGIFFQRESSSSSSAVCRNFLFFSSNNIYLLSFFRQEPQIHCIVHGCSNWAKPGWVYCSPACIRRHINDTLQAIQRTKGVVSDRNVISSNDSILFHRTMIILLLVKIFYYTKIGRRNFSIANSFPKWKIYVPGSISIPPMKLSNPLCVNQSC